MFDAQVVAFTVAVAILTMTPGSDTMLVFRSVLTRGRSAGLITTLGICTGLFVHATLSALGLSVILVQSALAYDIVKFLGVCYLIGLGVWTMIHAWRTPTQRGPDSIQPEESIQGKMRWWSAFAEGALNNMLNPKPAIFYLAFLPQFINPTDPVLLKSLFLAGIHFVLGVLWVSLLVAFIGAMSHWFTQSHIRRRLEIATGTVLIGLGIRLALERRG